jgi:peptidoglycan lytic transglycosylase
VSRRRVRSSSLLFFFALVTTGSNAAPARWLQAQPADEAETALGQVVASSTSGPPPIEALRAISERYPRSSASGLAQLAAGLTLLDADKPAEAMPYLSHPDIDRTALADRALLGLARALDGTRSFAAATQVYHQLLDMNPRGALACTALFRGSDSSAAAGHADEALPLLERMLTDCPSRTPEALIRLGSLQERRGDRKAAALAYDRLDTEYPATVEAREAAKRLTALRPFLPSVPVAERVQRDLRKALALSDAGRYRQAVPIYRSVLTRSTGAPEQETVRLRLGRALIALDQDRAAQPLLAAIPRTSPLAGEAAYYMAKSAARRTRSFQPFESVVASFGTTPWAEEALLDMAHHFDKDGRDAEAVPYYRRLLAGFPSGRYVDRATWATAWWDYRQGRFEAAAKAWEGALHARPKTPAAPRFLYWTARAYEAMGQKDRAQEIYAETVKRYKHAYHGLRAAAILGLVSEGASSTDPAPPPEGAADVKDPQLTRIRQLLLISRLDEALEELRFCPPSPSVHATIAWIEWQRGQLRPAITDMKRAYPEWVSQAGDALPDAVWRILYPLSYADALVAQAKSEGLDAALVAAVIWQESTFDPTAVSSAGARGLMQLEPPTGRSVARGLGLRYQPGVLHDPTVSLRLGTRYLRQMINAFGGRVEKALAAYNAGPTRVRTWSNARPGLSGEEFIESIPFPETRSYVTNILAHQEHYRRLYGLPPPAPQAAGASPAAAP